MRTTIYIYLPPDEWTIVFSWGSSNIVSFRIRAEKPGSGRKDRRQDEATARIGYRRVRRDGEDGL
jgi:hypothetical protein